MLCSSCKLALKSMIESDFSDLSRWQYKDGNWVVEFDYAPRTNPWDEWRRGTCSMCTMVIRHRFEPSYPPPVAPPSAQRIRQTVGFPMGFWIGTQGDAPEFRPDGILPSVYDFYLAGPRQISARASEIEDLDAVLPPDFYHQLGQDVLPDPSESAMHEVASGWVESCRESHPRCGKREIKIMPTRVLDVGCADGTIEPRIRITTGQLGEYVTLSHRWNECAKVFGTTKANLNGRLEEMPISHFPPVFRDAIMATRHLGFQYVWIDSICILQDDEKDWEVECQKMCQVFENAILTLSALRAGSDTVDGFLGRRREGSRNVLLRVGGKILGIRRTLGTFRDAIQSSEMNYRGWILQERVLSRAILHFGKTQVYWECCSCAGSESHPVLVPHMAGPLKHLFTTEEPPLRCIDQDPYLQWYQTIGIFTSKSLTVESDKLPAIMGLAERFQKSFQSTFLAGLWLEDLHRGLLWLPVREESGLYSQDIVPSWSWVKCHGIAVMEWRDRPDEVGTHMASLYHTVRQSQVTDFDIVDCRVSRHLPLPGRKMSGWIEGWGITVHVNINRQPRWRDENFAYLNRRDGMNCNQLPCVLDSSNYKMDSAYCLVVADWLSEYKWDAVLDGKRPVMIPKQRCYLVLTRVKRPKRNSNSLHLSDFRRIGVGGFEPTVVEQFFRTKKKRFLRLV